MRRQIYPAELLEISLFGGTDAETPSGAPSYFESLKAFCHWEIALRNVANWAEGQLEALFVEDNPAAVKGCNLLPLDENKKADKSQAAYKKGARDLSLTALVHLAQVSMTGQRGVAFLEARGQRPLSTEPAAAAQRLAPRRSRPRRGPAREDGRARRRRHDPKRFPGRAGHRPPQVARELRVPALRHGRRLRPHHASASD